MGEKARRGKGGMAKHGRHKEICKRYRSEHRREKNKIVKLSAMIKNLSPDNNMRKEVEKRIKELQKIV